MIDIEIETHANRICRNNVIDFARLIESDLRIARAWTERTQNNRRTAARATYHFSNCINFLGRKSDNSAAARQSRQFALAGKGQLRQARTRGDAHARHQTFDEAARRFSSKQQRFLTPSAIEQSVGENMAAIEIGAELLVKATKVNGIYSADPMKDPNAVRYPRLTFDRVLDERLAVMDATAIVMCRDNQLPLQVFNLGNAGDLLRIARGEDIGTVVYNQ